MIPEPSDFDFSLDFLLLFFFHLGLKISWDKTNICKQSFTLLYILFPRQPVASLFLLKTSYKIFHWGPSVYSNLHANLVSKWSSPLEISQGHGFCFIINNNTGLVISWLPKVPPMIQGKKLMMEMSFQYLTYWDYRQGGRTAISFCTCLFLIQFPEKLV